MLQRKEMHPLSGQAVQESLTLPNHENEGIIILQNISNYLPSGKTEHSRISESSKCRG
jgi:hypothetical protein